MTENTDFQHGTENSRPLGSRTVKSAGRALFGEAPKEFAAWIFNKVHPDLNLYRSKERNCWFVEGQEFLIRVQDTFIYPAVYAIFSRNPHEIIADGYVNGDWMIIEGNLDVVLAFFWHRQIKSNRLLQFARRLLDSPRFNKSQKNSPSVSKDNISNHYDLENPDNVLFEQMLGSTACYSSAIFDGEHQDLDSAQRNKLRIVCERMQLSRGMRVLDIGSGWGELATRLTEAGCDTTGITVSHNQKAYCCERYREQIAEGRLQFVFSDYRDFFAENVQKFDAISCIEVLDHIGLAHFDSFFEVVFENLNDGGTFFLQVITRPRPGQTSSWIDKHIYPGGYIASLKEIQASYNRAGFECLELENFSGHHYADTLREWRSLLEEFKRARATDFAFPETFYRKWEIFLASSILAFEHMGFANSHIVLKKNHQGLLNCQTLNPK